MLRAMLLSVILLLALVGGIAQAAREPMPDLEAMGYIIHHISTGTCQNIPGSVVQVLHWILKERIATATTEDAVSAIMSPHKLAAVIGIWFPNGDDNANEYPSELWYSKNADGYADLHLRANDPAIAATTICGLLSGKL